jgi:Arc/MetJ-type ribon-helix-helix transcriptional regulator
MSQNSKTPVAVKIPTSLYNSLVDAVSQGKYPNQTAGIVIALERDLDETFVKEISQLKETIQKQVIDIDQKEKTIQIIASDLSKAQTTSEGRFYICQEKDMRIVDLQKEIDVKNSQIEKQAFHIQGLIQENSRLNIKLLPENNKKPWWKFW